MTTEVKIDELFSNNSKIIIYENILRKKANIAFETI